jgi:hypothetical protein
MRLQVRCSFSDEHFRGWPIDVCCVFQPELLLPYFFGLTNYCFGVKTRGQMNEFFMKFDTEILLLEPGLQKCFLWMLGLIVARYTTL